MVLAVTGKVKRQRLDQRTDNEAGYLTQLLADLADTAKRNQQGLERRDKALAFAIRVPVLLVIAYGLLSLS